MSASMEQADSRMQRLEQATLWLQRMRAARPDDRIVEDWLDWCQRDPLNQQAFDEIAAIWELSGQARRQVQVAGPKPAMFSRRALAASLGGLGLAVAAGAWWWSATGMPGEITSEYTSPVGTNVTQLLADGSVLELGGGTRVTATIGRSARRVVLHAGELFTQVHPDANRPFSVDAGRLEVVATGTAFNVLRTAGRTTVTVTEGSVETITEGQSAAAPRMHLDSGQQLVYTHESHSVLVRPADPRNVLAWRSGMLPFEKEPLSEVIATVNRYSARQILIEDPRIGALFFTGTARADNIDGWLKALPHVVPVAVVDLTDGRRLIRSLSASTRID